MGRKLNGIMLAGVAAAGVGCVAETYGPGSVLTQGEGCDPISTTVAFAEAGDRVLFGIDDLSADAREFDLDIDDLDLGTEGRIEDKLLVEAAGVAGSTAVSEIVFSGEARLLEQIDTLPFDTSQNGDNELRVSVGDLRGERGGPDNDFSFQMREGDSVVTVTVDASPLLPDGVEVTFDQDCVPEPEVVD